MLLGAAMGVAAEWIVRVFLVRCPHPLREFANARAVCTILALGFLTACLPLRFIGIDQVCFYAVFLLCLFSAAIVDLYCMILPNVIVLPGLALALVYHAARAVFRRDASVFFYSAMGALVGGATVSVVIVASAFFLKQDGMGWGDMKFLMLIGASLSLSGGLTALFTAVLLNAAIGAVLLACKLIKLRTPVPFGPFLAVGALTSLYYGEPIRRWLGGLYGLPI